MSVLYLALPIALALGFAGMIACVFCLRSGQFDDLETPALRILIDDESLKQTNPQKRLPNRGREQETV